MRRMCAFSHLKQCFDVISETACPQWDMNGLDLLVAEKLVAQLAFGKSIF